MQIAIVGAGSMGEVLGRILLDQHVLEPEELCLVSRTTERLNYLRYNFPGSFITAEISESFLPDVIVLAVKPQDFHVVVPNLSIWSQKNPLVISIMTGIEIKTLESAQEGFSRVIRAMPNMPFMFGQGTTGFVCSSSVSHEDKGLFTLIFEKTGLTVELDDENQLDTVTALSGSGPGYLAVLYDHLVKGGVEQGLTLEQSDLLLRQTVHGFLAMLDNGLSPKEIQKLVASKGGTTEAAIQSLKKNKVPKALEEAIEKATSRARELRTGK